FKCYKFPHLFPQLLPNIYLSFYSNSFTTHFFHKAIISIHKSTSYYFRSLENHSEIVFSAIKIGCLEKMHPDLVTEEFMAKLQVKEESIEDEPKIDLEEEEDDDDDHEVELVDATEEEFSFVCGVLASPVAADVAFDNGQIRPFFPLFNQDLLLSDIDFQHLKKRAAPVNPPTTSNEEISGPYCEWSKKATNINNSADNKSTCKKSNSTGFSKLWRFRDFMNRSNSDGRDAFVYLNNNTTTTTTSSLSNVVKTEDKVVVTEKKEKINGDRVVKLVTQNKKKIKKSEAVLAHEVYMKSKAKHEERRRSYLPYRPDLVGFFTNVNGGLTRNVHPF
ncbi:hypothetical protein AABB24_028078, partial [Solanum stoloniferum]